MWEIMEALRVRCDDLMLLIGNLYPSNSVNQAGSPPGMLVWVSSTKSSLLQSATLMRSTLAVPHLTISLAVAPFVMSAH